MDNTQFEQFVAEHRAKLTDTFILQFHGRRFNVLKNEKTQHEVVMHPGAVIILALQDDDAVIMIRNERFAVGEILWELPAGTIEPDEAPEFTAMRELEEETGYKAAILEPLLNFYTTPGICNEVMYAYVAKDLHFVGQHLDQSEKIETQAIKLPQVLEMIKSGMIRDGKTIAALLFYSSFKV